MKGSNKIYKILIFISTLLFVALLIVSASESGPGDIFYPLDRSIETMEFAISSGERKSTLYARFAEERVFELDAFFKENLSLTESEHILKEIEHTETFINNGFGHAATFKSGAAILSLKHTQENFQELMIKTNAVANIVPYTFEKNYGKVQISEAAETCSKGIEEKQRVGLIHCTNAIQPGMILFQPNGSPATFLIDRLGRYINSWITDPILNGFVAYLLPNGDIVRASRSQIAISGRLSDDLKGKTGYLERIAWDGTVMWSSNINNDERFLHHDIKVLPNGNILAIAWEYKSPEEARTVGYDPELITENGLFPDVILEIRPIGIDDYEIVWEWHFWDLLVQDRDPSLSNYGSISGNYYKIDANFKDRSLHTPSDYLHCNSLDYNRNLDHILISCDETSEIYIIDYKTGNLLYRWGNPQMYNKKEGERVLDGPHNARWTLSDSITVFNNGRIDLQSYIIELTLPIETDRIKLLEDVGESKKYYKKIVLEKGLYSEVMSSAQILPNNNMLITSTNTGTIIEIDAEENEVWRYVIPIGAMSIISPYDKRDSSTLFNAIWYPNDYLVF